MDNKKICVAGIYAPNTDTPDFYSRLINELVEINENIVLIGDFNLTLNSSMDRCGTTSNNERSAQVVKDLMSEYKLCDTWRERNESERVYSWFKHGKNQEIKASRIDMALISAGLNYHVENITYIPGILTDHSAVYISLKIYKNERGTGYWKFNNSYLTNQNFIAYMEQELKRDIASTINFSAPDRWSYIKCKIKKYTKQWARHTVGQQKLVISQLMEKIDDLQHNMPLNRADSALLCESKNDLDQMVLKQAESIIFRSKAKWCEEGEHSTKYFLNLEKSNYNAKTCQCPRN